MHRFPQPCRPGPPRPVNLQGQSLAPFLENPAETGRGWALTQMIRGGGGSEVAGNRLRTARWRYSEWNQGERVRVRASYPSGGELPGKPENPWEPQLR